MGFNFTPEGLTFKLETAPYQTLHVNFDCPSLLFRIKRARHQGDPLLKALALKPNQYRKIVDATAGLGQDSFLLAALGHTVTLIERDERIYYLLQDGLKRAQHHEAVISRMSLHLGQAEDLLDTLKPVSHIYLDPMFPAKKKSALSNQSMEILKQLLDLDDQPNLLLKAKTIASERIVVKRPKHAPFLGNMTPSFSHQYRSCRFDIYLNHQSA